MPMPSSNAEPISTQLPDSAVVLISILPSLTSRSISLSTLGTISSFKLSLSMEVSGVHVQRLQSSMTICFSNVTPRTN